MKDRNVHAHQILALGIFVMLLSFFGSPCSVSAQVGVSGMQVPGDINQDGAVDISDATGLFDYLYLGGERPACPGGLDFNGDSAVDISDGVGILNWLFQGGAAHVLGTTCRAIPGCSNVCTASTQELYFDVLDSAEELVTRGVIPQTTLDYLLSEESVLSSDPEALRDAVRIDSIQPASAGDGGGAGGGIVRGATWTATNFLGFQVAEGTAEISWRRSPGDPCSTEITGYTASGGCLLGSVSCDQIGAKWTEACPESEWCEMPTRECGNYQVYWRQRFSFLITNTVRCPTETLCSPCVSGGGLPGVNPGGGLNIGGIGELEALELIPVR